MDLRTRIVTNYDEGGSTREEVARRYRVSLGMVKKLLAQRRAIGDIGPLHHRSGAKPKIQATHRSRMRELLARRPDLTLAELREAVAWTAHCPPSTTCSRIWGFHIRKDTARQRAVSSRHRADAAAMAAWVSRARPLAARLP